MSQNDRVDQRSEQAEARKDASEPLAELKGQIPDLLKEGTRQTLEQNKVQIEKDVADKRARLRDQQSSYVSELLGAKVGASSFELVESAPRAGELKSAGPTEVTNDTAKLHGEAPEKAFPGDKDIEPREPSLETKKYSDGTEVERRYSAQDLQRIAGGSVEDAIEAIKNYPGTDKEKAQFAIDIMGARVDTIGFGSVKEDFWHRVSRGEDLDTSAAPMPWVAKQTWKALNKTIGPGSGDEGLAEYTWNHQIARCGENAVLLKHMLEGAGMKDVNIVHTVNQENPKFNHDFVVVGKPENIANGKSEIFVADAHGAKSGWRGGGIRSGGDSVLLKISTYGSYAVNDGTLTKVEKKPH